LAKLAALEQAGRALKAGQCQAALPDLRESLRFFEDELPQHFRHEEQALFPVLARFIGRAGPIGAMLGEHESLWRNVDEFTALVEGLEDAGCAVDAEIARETARLAHHIIFLLRGHIDREDTMLFPLAERTLDERAKREVNDSVELLDRVPR
jgi:hemerythrin-like domain-containing protein